MQPWLAAHARKHLSMTSVTRWEVSTLPPTTAAVADGLRRDPSGMRISTGARHPLRTMANTYREVRRASTMVELGGASSVLFLRGVRYSIV